LAPSEATAHCMSAYLMFLSSSMFSSSSIAAHGLAGMASFCRIMPTNKFWENLSLLIDLILIPVSTWNGKIF
jgi:hypothetical protein